ncbi:MAG TPA: translation initiation factor [Salinimicrobium sp.]|nr:translation initiation factor [Salinimicrobium sp.]
MAKKKLGLDDLGGFVFSTNQDFEPEDQSGDDVENLEPTDQFLEAHYSSKGRAGKKVTIVTGFKGTSEDLIKLGKDLKKKCGVGGSVKDGEIIIQGDVREKVMDILQKEGYNVKRVGG